MHWPREQELCSDLPTTRGYSVKFVLVVGGVLLAGISVMVLVGPGRILGWSSSLRVTHKSTMSPPLRVSGESDWLDRRQGPWLYLDVKGKPLDDEFDLTTGERFPRSGYYADDSRVRHLTADEEASARIKILENERQQ